MNNRLKELIFSRLYKKLRNVEIIPYKDSIWFIDREKEYWYFEFDKSGTLWWRYHFFTSFFEMFSMTRDEFTPILSSWVEEVLNHKVSTTVSALMYGPNLVEEVLNHKVDTTRYGSRSCEGMVGEVLNHKVSTTKNSERLNLIRVENALKYKVSTSPFVDGYRLLVVEEVLNHRVSTTASKCSNRWVKVEEVIKHKVTETQTGNAPPLSFVKDVLNYK